MSDTNIPRGLVAAAMLASGLLWPAQGHAYCSILASKMEQAVCDMEDRARWQQLELERLDDRVKEMEREELQRSLADIQRRRDDEFRDFEARLARQRLQP